MNKVLGAALGILAAFILTACGSSGSAPVVTVTAPAAPAPAPAPAPVLPQEDDLYGDLTGIVEYVRAQDASFYAVSEATIVETGTQICLAVGSGTSVRAIVGAAIESGLTSNQTAAIIVGAVMYLCPEYRAQVESQL